MLKKILPLLLTAWSLWSPPAFAQDAPEISRYNRFDDPYLPLYNDRLMFTWARYFTSNPDFDWLGQIASEWETKWPDPLSLYFLLQVDTIAGHRARSFDLNQASFVLEPGARYPIPRGTIELAYHHLSRHAFDRSPGTRKLGAWDTPTLLIEQGVPFSFGGVGGSLAAGKAINKGSVVDYDWEARGALIAEFHARRNGIFYLSQENRYVRLESQRSDGKDHFWDLTTEAGFRLLGREWDMVFFAQHQHKNDVDRVGGKSETWNLLGIRFER